MAVASRKIRSRMLMTTALVAVAAMPGVAHAQLVTSGDLSSAVDSAGNPGQLTVTDTSATQTDIEIEAAVVVAEWTDFNIGTGDTVNVTIDGGLGIAEATLFNRVIGANPSNIDGTLNAAGINFWLVNQNGILFGNDTAINAQSFFASTVDVANQDVFDFYEGTDLFGNGTDTLNFAGVSTAAVQALGNASFVTDGSLAFVGQQLDLTGSFDAGTGRAIFVTASDVDVSFTAGSPLTYTVNAGTTIAAQNIDGSIQGASAEFAMFTAAGVVGALLDIDATVTATTALATDTGIALLASGPSSVTVEIGGEFSSTGEVVLNSNGDLTATANISGSDLDIDATGAISSVDLTSSDGDLNLNAGTTIMAGVLETSGAGGATLTAAGNITTTSITSNEPGLVNGFIDAESTGGGTLDLGALSSDGNIDLDTSGLVTTSTINSLGDLTIGGTTDPGAVTFTGNVSADAIDIDTTGVVTALDIESTDGDLNILAGDSISAGGVTATEGDVILSATNNITTTSISSNENLGTGGAIDVDSTGGGTLDLGAVSGDGAANLDTTGTLTLGLVNIGGALVIGAANQPTTLNLNDDITAGSFTFTSANPFVSQDITTTDGDLNIDAASITTGNLEADNGGGVILTATGNITTTSITSNEPGVVNGFIDVESTGGGTLDLGALSSDGNIDLDTSGLVTTSTINSLGDLTIGGTTDPGAVTFTGNVSADAIDIDTTGVVTALD
ncbi:filamentous hemagglutinin N-terminal domain-containing protein, partial [uncultured Erythrobacter sp.]|uniref:beta strand repeat-containing protein n=1 Tax=uncultured Erythrobacter sp. TaxID=263913 RepID=UPI0026365FB5